tara:strand:+ start:1865 stop:2524 length:660 start_codon:yes stop_codon:yes gene_type:complete
MERVSTFQGSAPVIVVAPNCPDEQNTDEIAQMMIHQLNCFGVINRGWKKAKNVDYINDQADCNYLIHLKEDVVRDEFLNPVINFSNRIFKKYPQQPAFMFNIIGVENNIRRKANDQSLDLVLGYGQGQSSSSYTCEEWRKDLFCYLCKKSSITCYAGSGGSGYAARSKFSLIQLFRQHMRRTYMQAMQIGVVEDLRNDKDLARITGDFLADIVQWAYQN